MKGAGFLCTSPAAHNQAQGIDFSIAVAWPKLICDMSPVTYFVGPEYLMPSGQRAFTGSGAAVLTVRIYKPANRMLVNLNVKA